MSQKKSKPGLGPTLVSTITTNDAETCIDAWCNYLEQHVFSRTAITDAEAEHLKCQNLSGCEVTWLANELNEPWLRIIQTNDCRHVAPFKHYGWLSLEVSVKSVDELRPQLENSPFEIIGEPADLDVSDDIRAMQVVGPAGEVLYLTEIKAPVPGFDLPMARCKVDKLFIPVALVENRDKARDHYTQFPDVTSMEFDTKITVINRAKGLPISQKHPISTVQLAGCNLIELDELANLKANLRSENYLAPGISMISIAIEKLPENSDIYTIEHGPYTGYLACIFEREGGELVELIQSKNSC